MRLSKRELALALVLVLNVVLVILLTPIGFESRPPTELKTVGYVAIGAVFAGLILHVASIILLFRRVKLASILAIIGSIVLLFPNVGDQTGSFFSSPIPPVINTLEYIFIVALLVTIFLASTVYKERESS